MARPPSRGATIRIFLVDGTPQGMRLVERMGWTGCCLAFARSDYPNARARAELMTTGVYVLLGPDPAGRRTQRAYLGEADDVRIRLDAHQKEKDFWTHGFVLTTKDNSLNKAHVRYLEARLIELAGAADNATLDNGTAPPAAGLGEPETAEMEAYLDNALMLFPLVGVNIFDVVTEAAVAHDAVDEPLDLLGTATTRLRLKTQLTEAEGHDSARGFVVYEGARGRREQKVMMPSYARLREQLIEEGILAPEGSEQLVLTRRFAFDSPSAAASVLSGGNKNGRTEWKDAAGRTLKDIQATSAS